MNSKFLKNNNKQKMSELATLFRPLFYIVLTTYHFNTEKNNFEKITIFY